MVGIYDPEPKIESILENWDDETWQESIDRERAQVIDQAYACARTLQDLKASERSLAEEIERLQRRKAGVARRIDRIRTILLYLLDLHPQHKFKNDKFTIFRQKRPARIRVVDPASLDPEYVKIEEVLKPKTDDLNVLFKGAGEIPRGCELVPETFAAVVR